ncbi:MAG: peptidoglycan DD-metalloendopeptidase family protein [Alphaproteobacteria bacterium]|nr:peptidoglycan DD-metalloendopeptidase family protein [Alphaproteobacteria bacterium]
MEALQRAERDANEKAAELKRREERLAADPRAAGSEELKAVRRDRELAVEQARRLKVEIAALADYMQKFEAARKEQADTARKEREAALRAAEQQRRIEEAGKQAERLRRERRDAGLREQQHEREVARRNAEAERLAAEEAGKRADLKRRSEQRDRVLAALVRLSGGEPVFLVALPGEPLESVQGALAFRFLEQDLRRRSGELAMALDDLAQSRATLEGARRRLDAERAALAAEKARLERMLGESADDQRRAAGLRQKEIELAERLRGEARDREELMAALVKDRHEREAREAAERKAREEAERRARETAQREAQRKAREAAQRRTAAPERDQLAALTPPGAPVSAPSTAPEPRTGGSGRPADIRNTPPPRGAMLNPVAGRIVRQFGQTDDAGTASKGVVFAAGQAARVVAPFDGQVVYAGPFRGFGRILIIEHGGGYHTMLSGLGRIDCAVGQWVVAGEPVAVMGDQGGAGLYVELRRDGQPVNPIPWLAAGTGGNG